MHDTRFPYQEDPLTHDNRSGPPPHIVAKGAVRAVIATRSTSSAESQTRLFWD